jgi:4-amino-4-deoxy-L-arabinose transferase-like glycosyltransferase
MLKSLTKIPTLTKIRGSIKIHSLAKVRDFSIVFFTSYFVYLLTLYPTVGTEDSGELITSAVKLDIAHPSGYPLHTLVGWLFNVLIPFGNPGWRVNVSSAFFAAAAIAVIYLIIKRLTKNDILAMSGALFLAFTDIFWSQAIRTEVYALNIFFIVLIALLLLLWDETKENKYLYLVALCLGLGLADSHQIILAALPIFIFVLVRNWRVIIEPKIIAGALLALTAGLAVYAYLPIRTAIAPYDNPAYINHTGLYTWETFSRFVGRSIYGGTINISHESTEETTEETAEEVAKILPPWLMELKDTFLNYGHRWAENNYTGFFYMILIIFDQLLLIPVLLFVPGIYYLSTKHKKYSLFLALLFIFYTSVQLMMIGVTPQLHPFTLFSNRPFYIPAIVTTLIISICGLQLIFDALKKLSAASADAPRRRQKLILKALLFTVVVLPLFPLASNFASNNESKNYIAHDFSKNLLESLPPNAYMLSTGKDNLTFPLYYLRKAENLRTDVDLEIYYGRTCVDKSYLDGKLEEKNAKVIFIDLLPCNYLDLNLVPYNFVYAYGDTGSLPETDIEKFALRGIRQNMDYPNNKLKALYYLKQAVAQTANESKMNEYFSKVAQEIPEQEQWKNFITDFRTDKDDTGMF